MCILYIVMISMDISIFPRVFCSQLYAATKAKRRMEEERMGKLEKYREDYEVSSVFFYHVVPFKGMPGDRDISKALMKLRCFK